MRYLASSGISPPGWYLAAMARNKCAASRIISTKPFMPCGGGGACVGGAIASRAIAALFLLPGLRPPVFLPGAIVYLIYLNLAVANLDRPPIYFRQVARTIQTTRAPPGEMALR